MRAKGLAFRALLLVAPAVLLAFANTASLRAHWNLDNIGTSRRYWEDLTVAYSLYETRNWGPTEAVPIGDTTAAHVNRKLHEVVPRAVQREGVQPWEFWRVVEFRGFANLFPFELRFSDDTGRARLSAFGFRLLGGTAPYLPLWLPFLFFVPFAAWFMFECLRCGEAVAGGFFLILLASSAYFLEALTLAYSAVGFHLLAGLTLVPLALFSFGPPPNAAGLWARTVLTSAVIHVATLCRSSCLVFLPPAALLLLVALFRVEAQGSKPDSSTRRRVLHALLVLAILGAPRALAPRQSHELWIGMWEGLGDFDREHGHEWSDFAARVVLDREGYSMAKRGPYWTEETEGIFRRLVLEDVKNDPFWYASILGHRALATLTQWRLWPTARETGLSYRPAEGPGEGYVETYYNFVTTADGFTLLGRRWEAPLWLLWISGLAFLASVLRAREPREKMRLGVFTVFVLAALIMPVVITTMSGIETQFIVLGYLLGAAFLGSDAIRFALRRASVTP